MAAAAGSDTIRFRIPSNPAYVPMVRRAIRSIANSLGFPEEIAEDIELSVDEALANAVEHGSPQQGRNTVAIVCRVESEKLIIDVRDEGLGYEPSSAGEGCSDLFDERGRGLTLIYNLMDKVNVSCTRNGSRIRMVKARSAPDKSPRMASAH